MLGLLPNAFNAQAGPLDNWHVLYPTETANTINAICGGGGRFVAVGDYGTILSSPNGKNWSGVNTGIVASLWGVTYGNGLFVAVGDGAILTSTNSLDWITNESELVATNFFEGVTFGGGLFVGFNSDTIFLSTNGQVWAATTQGFDMESVVYGDGVFEASGAGGNTGYFFASPDGVNWTPANEQNISSNLVEGGLLFYANGYFATTTANVVSSNGIDWSSQNYPAIHTILAYVNGEFVIPSGGFTYTSTDFLRWSANNASNLAGEGLGAGAWNPGAYAAGVFVSYGNLTSEDPSIPPHLLYSTNAVNWYAADSDDRNDLYAVAYYNGAIIAGGAGGVFLESTNGQNWTEYSYGSNVMPGGAIYDIADAGSAVVATALVDGEVLISLDSTNGTNWTSGVIDSTSVYWPYSRIVFGNGAFVASDGLLENSANGVQWQSLGGSFAYIEDVAFGNGLFVGVGGGGGGSGPGLIVTSTDGMAWQFPDSESPEFLQAVVYGNGQWIAFGPSGTVATSPDGTNWSASIFGGPSITDLTRLTFWNGLYVTLQEAGPSGGYAIGTSPDGYTWTYHSLPTSLVMYGFVFAENSLIVVGQNGTILQSAPLSSPPISLAGQVTVDKGSIQLTVSGVSGRQISLQGSTNLTTWITLTNLVSGAPSIQIIDSITNSSQKFYRVIAQ